MNIYVKFLSIFFSITVLFPYEVCKADESAAPVETSYRVEIEQASQGIAIVTATFTPEDNKLYMFHGANNFPERWAKFVSHLKVTDSSGKVINTSRKKKC